MLGCPNQILVVIQQESSLKFVVVPTKLRLGFTFFGPIKTGVDIKKICPFLVRSRYY